MGGSSSFWRTNWKEVLHPEQTAARPPGDAVTSNGAPHRLQGGPSAGADTSERSPASVDTPAGAGAPRPGSTAPSNSVKE